MIKNNCHIVVVEYKRAKDSEIPESEKIIVKGTAALNHLRKLRSDVSDPKLEHAINELYKQCGFEFIGDKDA